MYRTDPAIHAHDCGRTHARAEFLQTLQTQMKVGTVLSVGGESGNREVRVKLVWLGM